MAQNPSKPTKFPTKNKAQNSVPSKEKWENKNPLGRSSPKITNPNENPKIPEVGTANNCLLLPQ